MTIKTEKTARVHRFHDCIALHTGGTPTVYLSEGMARKMARALLDCARDVKGRKFTDSQFSTRDIEETAPSPKQSATVARYGAVLRCYDNGGKTCDRYTIIPPRWAAVYRNGCMWECVAASEKPFHPQGFGAAALAAPGPHLGRRVSWQDLPPDVQKFARQAFPEFCPNHDGGRAKK